MCWRRRWHPTPALLPGKSHGQRSLVAYSSCGCQESDTTEWFHFHALEKEMAPHSSVLAWRIPETGEPGGLPSMGSHRVGYDWSDLVAAANDVLSVEHLVGGRLEARALHPDPYLSYFIPLFLCGKWDTHLYQTYFLITYTIYQAPI